MHRTTRWLSTIFLSAAFLSMSLGSAWAQKSAPAGRSTNSQNTNRGMVEISLKGKAVSIDYGRPELQGRDMLGQAPDGFVWRLGMNESTTFKTDTDLMFGTKKLAKGVYSAWAKHISGDKWVLVFNSEVGIWGTPGAKRANDVLEVPLTYTKKGDSVERLTIDLMAMGNGGHMLVSWAQHRLEVMFTPN